MNEHLYVGGLTMTDTEMDKDMEQSKHTAAMVATASLDEINAEARIAADNEHSQTFLEAVRLYPAAIGWSLFFSLGVIM
jgi:hypothetical protein